MLARIQPFMTGVTAASKHLIAELFRQMGDFQNPVPGNEGK